MCITKQLENICKKVACNLMTMYKYGNSNMLIFPFYRSKEVRVSEQEARISFVSEIEKLEKYFYAVEVPTKNRYSDFETNPKIYDEKIKGGRSGSIDLSLFAEMNNAERNNNAPLVNIEFKSGQPKDTSITKDILKLLYEEHKFGIFYHVLEHTNSGTVRNLVKKFESSINKIKQQSNQFSKIGCSRIYFCIVILENDKNKSRYSSYCFDFKKNLKISESNFSNYSFYKDLKNDI